MADASSTTTLAKIVPAPDFSSAKQSNELCSLAKRIPKARKGATLQESQTLEARRQSLIRSVDLLCKNEAYAVKVWEMLQLGQIVLDTDCQQAKHEFASAPKCINKIESTWKAAFLVKHSGGLLTLPMVQNQDKLDEHFVADALRMFLKAAGTETLPPECKDKEVLDRALYLRYEKVSPHESIGTWAARCISEDGSKIDWASAGAYILQFDSSSGLLKTLQHRASGHVATVPEDISIDKSFNYTSPASDKLALLAKGRLLKYFCIDFFDTHLQHGPHAYHFDKRQNEMKTLVQLAADYVAETRAPTAPASAEVVLTDHCKARRDVALAKARARLSEQPSKRARTFVLQDDNAPPDA